MPQNSDDEIARRRANVARLYLKGYTQAEIAQEESVTQQQVSLDLAAIREKWTNSPLFDFNEAKNKELAKLDLLENTLWEAWKESKRPLKKKSTKMRGEVNQPNASDKEKKNQQVKNLETSEYTEERLGDPRYTDGIWKCIQKRCDLLGLDAPFKIAQTDTEGKNVEVARTWNLLDHTGGKKVPEPDEIY